MISTAIQQLVNYGLDTGLILPDDEIYIRNQLLMTMQLDDFTAPEGEACYTDLESILKALVDDAVARGVCEDNSTARDLFDTKLMGVLTPRPSIVRANFEERYESEISFCFKKVCKGMGSFLIKRIKTIHIKKFEVIFPANFPDKFSDRTKFTVFSLKKMTCGFCFQIFKRNFLNRRRYLM